MMKITHIVILALASFLSVACVMQENEQELEPGCLDVILCSEKEAENDV